jgi:hypothetical protein
MEVARGSYGSAEDQGGSITSPLLSNAHTSRVSATAPLGLGASHEPLWAEPTSGLMPMPHLPGSVRTGGVSRRASLAKVAARRHSLESPQVDDSSSHTYMPQDLDG